jgi:hypothetical protein
MQRGIVDALSDLIGGEGNGKSHALGGLAERLPWPGKKWSVPRASAGFEKPGVFKKKRPAVVPVKPAGSATGGAGEVTGAVNPEDVIPLESENDSVLRRF